MLEFGDIRKVGAALRRECGPRRSRALAVLTFMATILPAVGLAAHESGIAWSFVWFLPPLLLLFAIVAYRTPGFAWREIGISALAGTGATWLFLSAATIDIGERDGFGIVYAPSTANLERSLRERLATVDRWGPLLHTMSNAYDKGDPVALTSLTSSQGFLAPHLLQRWNLHTDPLSTLTTVRTADLEEAKSLWRVGGRSVIHEVAVFRVRARDILEGIAANPTLAGRFVPQLRGYLPTACQVAAYAFCLGTAIHLLMLGLRFVVGALWRRLRLGVAA